MILYISNRKRICRQKMINKDNEIIFVEYYDDFLDAVNNGYVALNVPDPMYKPDEVTKVSDIINLHRKGVSVDFVGGLRSTIQDPRTPEQMESSPTLESDKLYPSFAILTSQNAQYAQALDENVKRIRDEVNQRIEYQKVMDSINDNNIVANNNNNNT